MRTGGTRGRDSFLSFWAAIGAKKREREGWGLGRRWLLIQQIHTTIKLSRLWQWGGSSGGRATGEERAGDSRGVALAVKLIDKKMKE